MAGDPASRAFDDVEAGLEGREVDALDKLLWFGEADASGKKT